MSDELASRLRLHFSVVLKDDAAARRRLFTRDWNKFINSDRPETHDPVHMAVKAIEYVGLDLNGRWYRDDALLAVVFSFLSEATGIQPDWDDPNIAVIHLELDNRPVNPHAVRQLLHDIYGYPEQGE